MMIFKPIEKIYQLLVSAKNYLYEQRFINTITLNVPVVSIGNISFGGVGKTPFVIFIGNELASDYKINIITKSYKASLTEPKLVNLNLPNAPQIFGDEACLIQTKLPNCSVWSGPNKSDTAVASIVNLPSLILLDDGFSHRKLHRNFDLVLIDATQGFNDYLRESVKSLLRADAILITKANLSSSMAMRKIKNSIIAVAPHLKDCIFTSEVKTEFKIEKSNPVFVFCGLGRPETFIQDISQQGYAVIQKIYFADHFNYPKAIQENIYKQYLELKKKYKNLKLVTTEKDFIKLTVSDLKNELVIPVHTIVLDTDQKGSLIEKIRQSL